MKSLRSFAAALAVPLLLSGCGFYPSVATRTERAVAQIRAGEYAAAEGELEKALGRVPGDARVLGLMAAAELNLGKPVQAQAFSERASRAGGGSEELRIIQDQALLDQRKFAELLKLTAAQSAPTDAIFRAAAQTGLKQYDAAEATLAAARAASPNDPRVLLRMAELRAARGKTAEAAELLRQASQSDSAPVRVWLLLGAMNMSVNLADARSAFERVTKLEPGRTTLPERMQGLAGLADTYLAENNLPRATEINKTLRALAPGSTVTHYLEGRIALQGGNPQKAVNELTVVTNASPDDAQAATLLGAALLAQGTKEQALATLSSVVARHPDFVYARRLLAQAQLAADQPAEARRTLTTGGVSDAGSDALMAAALVQSGDTAAALPYLERSVKANPGDVSLQAQLARAYLVQGDGAKARALLEAIPAGKRDKRVQTLLVLARIAGKNQAEALRSLDQMVQANPADQDLLAVAGVYAQKLGSTDTAARYFSQVLEKDPRSSIALLGTAEMAARRGDFSAARDRLTVLLAAEPGHQQATLALADIELKQGRIAEARRWLERLISIDPSNLAGRLVLARLEYHEGNASRAKALLDQAVSASANKGMAENAAGEAALAAGQAGDAATHFTAAVTAGSEPARINLAKSQLLLKNPAEARRTLEAVAQQPFRQQASFLLAGLDAQEGHIEDAHKRVAALRQQGVSAAMLDEADGDIDMVAKDAAGADRYYGKAFAAAPTQKLAGKLYQLRKDRSAADAQAILKTWLARSPDDRAARRILAWDLQQRGNKAAAIVEYEALSRDPDVVDAQVLNNLAWLYLQSGDARALETGRRAYDAAADNPQIMDTYAWVMAQQGDLQRSKELLESAAVKAPTDPSIAYHLAAVRARTGDNIRAGQSLRALLSSNASFAERAEAEKLLGSLPRG